MSCIVVLCVMMLYCALPAQLRLGTMHSHGLLLASILAQVQRNVTVETYNLVS